MSIIRRITRALSRFSSRGRESAETYPVGEIEPASESSVNLSYGRLKKRLIGYNSQIAEPLLLAQVEDQGIDLNTISVGWLDLGVRASKRLRTANIDNLQHLVDCTQGDLLSIDGLGMITVEKIKDKLSAYLCNILDEIPLKEQARAEARHIFEKLLELASRLCSIFGDHAPLDEIRLPYLAQQRLYKAIGERPETLADLKRLTELHSPQFSTLERVEQISTNIDLLEQAVDWLYKELTYGSIDDEVNKLVRHLDDRERFLLTNRFGIEKHMTLEMLGEQFRITRERVRQIESKMRDKLVKKVARSSLLYSAAGIALMKRLGEDATVDLWRQRLMDIGFLKEEASTDLLVAVSRVANTAPLALPKEFDHMLEPHVSPHILLAREPVLNKARRFCRNCGAIRIVSLTSEKLSEADVEQLLCLDGFTEVYSGWWMKKVGECVPERVTRKVITYCGHVSPSNLRQALIRHLSRRQFPAPPSEVLVKTLEQTGKFALVDGFLELTEMPTRKPRLTGPESIFVRLVQGECPIVSFESIRANVIDEGFSAASVPTLLSHSQIVEKVAFGLYTLLGTQYDLGDVERAKSELIRVPANASMKPRSDGVIELQTNIGTWMIYSGVLNCGPAASMEGTWTRIVDGVNSGELVVGGGFIRGLSEVVESLDLMPGDRIKIEFNTWTRGATITKVVNNEQIC